MKTAQQAAHTPGPLLCLNLPRQSSGAQCVDTSRNTAKNTEPKNAGFTLSIETRNCGGAKSNVNRLAQKLAQSCDMPFGVVAFPSQANAQTVALVVSSMDTIETTLNLLRSNGSAQSATADGIESTSRLIAAAPELLEMLSEALPYVEEGEEFNKPSGRTLSKRIRAILEATQ